MAADEPPGPWRSFERSRNLEDARYWDIRVSGCVLEVRHGRLAGDRRLAPECETETFASPAEARTKAKRKVRTKLKVGWVEVALSAVHGVADDELIQSLEAELDFEDPGSESWMVYADYLSSAAPALGERVALAVARARTEDPRESSELDRRIAELEVREAHGLFGRQLAAVLRHEAAGETVEMRRFNGMILGARIRLPSAKSSIVLVEKLLRAPAARLLRELIVHRHRGPSIAAACVACIEAHAPAGLRALAIDDLLHTHEHRSNPAAHFSTIALPYLGRASGGGLDALEIVAALPKLERLALAGQVVLNGLHSDKLETLEVIGNGETGWPDRLAELELPNLRALHVGLRERELPVFWRARTFDRLESLSLEMPERMRGRRYAARRGGGTRFSRFVRGLEQAPLPSSIQTLAVTNSFIPSGAADWLIRNRHRLADIPRVDLSRNAVTWGGPALLAALPQVVLDDQAQDTRTHDLLELPTL